MYTCIYKEKEDSFPLVVCSSVLAVVTVLKKYKKLIYKMNRIEVLKSSRGNSMIYFSGYLYTEHRVTEEKRMFRCEDRTCRSKYKFLNLMIQVISDAVF